MAVIEGATVLVSASSSTNLSGTSTFELTNSVRLIVRALGAGIYIGNSGVSGAASGFLLLADKDYEFVLNPGGPKVSAAGSDFQPYVYNSTGSAVSVTYAVTPL